MVGGPTVRSGRELNLLHRTILQRSTGFNWNARQSSRIIRVGACSAWTAISRHSSIKPIDTGETYDLAAVGGGISGLAAAYFHCKHAVEMHASLFFITTTILGATPSATSSTGRAAPLATVGRFGFSPLSPTARKRQAC